MLNYPEIDPVALSIGPLTLFERILGPVSIHWYGVMYLCAFAGAWGLGVWRASKPNSPLSKSQIEDLIFYGALGVVLGGRCGYVLFYNFPTFLEDPGWLFRVWEGGMSFHGGLLGVIVAMMIYAKKVHKNFIDVMDFVAPIVPLGLAFGRFGNFIGQELWGRETTVNWGMVFPKDPELLVRHPSQLYQMALEGVVLFVILLWFSSKPRPRAAVSALFLIGYGCARFFVEFYREPDVHIGFDIMGWMTRGQLLTLPMIIIGVSIFVFSYRLASVKSAASTKKAGVNS